MPDSQSDLLRVLVVDDDAALREMLTHVLNREGCISIAVDCAEEALKALPESTFDVAFIDRMLPGIDGVVFGEYLRRSHPEMHVALVTGDDTKRVAQQARKLAMTFIAKPFALAAIIEVLDAAKAAKAAKRKQWRAETTDDFAPPFARYSEELAEAFQLPSVPRRAHDALVDSIKTHLNSMRHDRRYDERSRVAALAGLLTARVIGTELPRGEDGRTLFEEYDDIMKKRGKRLEFAG